MFVNNNNFEKNLLDKIMLRLTAAEKELINNSLEKAIASLMITVKSPEISPNCRDEIEDIVDALLDMKG